MTVQYCQYTGGSCEADTAGSAQGTFFLFASEPAEIADTIQAATQKLQQRRPGCHPSTWKHLDTPGQMIFCEVCRGIRGAATVVADVTTLNFNVLFELGFALGLGVPTVPIRDTTYGSDKRLFDQLGMLDTLGYLDFSESDGLAGALSSRVPGRPLPPVDQRPEHTSPLYLIRAPILTDGGTALLSGIKKSGLKFRSFDPAETNRLPLAEARRQVAKSMGVTAHLLGTQRGETGRVHDARCAIVAGLALAQEQVVALFDSSGSTWPIDYRDIIVTYSNPGQIKQLLEGPVRAITGRLQSARLRHRAAGNEHPAENRSRAISQPRTSSRVWREYFVPTGQSRPGAARLMHDLSSAAKGLRRLQFSIDVRGSSIPQADAIVLDLKPEGHQFLRFKEVGALQRLSAGLQEHTMAAFWNYVLLIEIARKVLRADQTAA